MRKVIAIIVTAFAVGVVHSFIKPQLDAIVPANLKSNWVTQSIFTGGFILAAIVVATTVLRAVGAPRMRSAA
jgi:hypothetical protein